MFYEELYTLKRYRCYNCGNNIELQETSQRDIFLEFKLSMRNEKKKLNVSHDRHLWWLKNESDE